MTESNPNKIILSFDKLLKVFPQVNPKIGAIKKQANLKGFVDTFNNYAGYFAIDTPLEAIHFCAQVSVECDRWNALEEYASGKAYEWRKDLGNTHVGDGMKFKGHGELQTTGLANHLRVGREIMKLPFLTAEQKKPFENDGILNNPSILSDPFWATISAFIYWVDHDLNNLCLGKNVEVSIKRLGKSGWYNYKCLTIEAITRKVNGGMNGYDERVHSFDILAPIIS